MCGRFTLHASGAEIARRFGLRAEITWPPRYNIAPSQETLVVRTCTGDREVSSMRWGLVPSWAKDRSVGYRMINARAETVADKPAFGALLRRRRCLIPASGFYEWKTEGRSRRPFYICLQDQSLMALAGLWDEWRDPAGTPLQSFTIITTSANALVGRIHDRMPAILSPAAWDDWLDIAEKDPTELQALLCPFRSAEMRAWPVDARVNRPRNDEPGLIESAPALD